MSDLITIEDLINTVHHLVDYDIKKQLANDKLLKPILTVDEQINVKFFKNLTDYKNITYIDEYTSLQQHFSSQQIEFFSFLYCIFNDLSDQFRYSNNKEEIINHYINDFKVQLKKKHIIQATPTFELKKDITNDFNNQVLSHDLIQFISIYFNINIFVINNNKNCVIFYTLNQYFNRFKHSVILIKTQRINYNLNVETDYYKNIYYNDDTKQLLMELFVNYPKMIIYSQLITKSIEPVIDNTSFLIVKQMDDNDLNIIEYGNNKNKIQNDIKNKRKIERKTKKKEETNNKADDTTESMINDIMIITSFTPETLTSKNYKELRAIAKANKIKLSYADSNNKRINKTRQELIDELLKIKK